MRLSMAFYIISGIISLFVILASCEFFTNAVEWTGKKCNFNEGVTGSILAAVGTALPETIVPIIAVIFVPGQKGQDIGTGAILGAPFMLSTLAFGITGLAVVLLSASGRREPVMEINKKILSNDMIFFMAVYILAILFSFLPQGYKRPCGFVFILIYIYYVYITFKHERPENSQDLRRLYFSKKKDPELPLVILQDIVSIMGIIIGAKFFVSSLEHVSTAMNFSPFIFSLFAAPVATELPEKFNSIIWVNKKKDTLALGNISGAMVFQSSIVVFVGIMATEWTLSPKAILSAVIALSSSLVIIIFMKTTKKLHAYALMPGILFYALYIILILNLVN
jgi:cation:H+ antiporter